MLRRPKADKANSGRHVYPLGGRTSELRRGESAMDRKRGEGRGAGCRTPGVSAGAAMMPHRLLALLGVLGACLATSGPAHAVTVTLPSAQDSWFAQDSPNTNHGTDAHMHVRTEVGKVRRGIIQFGLSSIPACASIDSATLQISIENAGNSSRIYEVHRVAASWTELGVTWNRRNSTTLWTSAGGDFVAAPTDSVPTGTVDNVLLQWNVTPDVAAFVSGAATNAGWLVKDSVENGTRKEFILRNREDTDGGGPQPHLVVTYTLANTPACDDGNACTTDTCDPVAGCQYASVANGIACDDGDACTQSDTCQGGSCTGTNPVVCTAQDQCHNAGTCDPASGLCSNPAKPDGAACNDGDACTQTDTCQGGSCTGTNPVVCTAQDQCHNAGTCDPASGLCSNPAKPDGAACNDGDACTQTDTCQGGSCTGTNPVVCTAQDQCHNAGTCDPASGQCSNPAKADGAACSDGDACTQADTCQAGACTGGNPVACTAQNQCHVAGVCDPASGLCSNPAKADATACHDGDACTQTATCQAGTCTG